MLRQLILSIFVLMLISCGSTQWVKPGATQEELEADTVTCNNQIVTSRVGARAMMGMGAPTTRGRIAATSGARVEADMERAKCLQSKGWTQETRE
jgi:hypothetical protein